VGMTSSSVVLAVHKRLARPFRSQHGILKNLLYLQVIGKSPETSTNSKSAFKTLTASLQKAGTDMEHLLGILVGCTQTTLLQKVMDRITSLTDPGRSFNFGIPYRFMRKRLSQRCSSHHNLYSQVSRLPHSTPEESG
jgi:hypothetical protein